MKVVVCDEDPTLRGVVSGLATRCGHDVLAETDSAPAAVDMVLRFGAEVLVIDLALPWGAGLQAVRDLHQAGTTAEIVLFTSYAADSPEVRGSGVRSVIEKPDIASLEAVFLDLASGLEATTPAGADRRSPIDPHSTFPRHGAVSASGIEEPDTFDEATVHLVPGDAVLVLHVEGIGRSEGWFQRLDATDALLAAVRLVRGVLRVQDRLSLLDTGPDDRPVEIVALLVGGGLKGVDAVWRRLIDAQLLAQIPGVISGGWAACTDSVSGPIALGRAVGAAAQSIGAPEGDRLWAG